MKTILCSSVALMFPNASQTLCHFGVFGINFNGFAIALKWSALPITAATAPSAQGWTNFAHKTCCIGTDIPSHSFQAICFFFFLFVLFLVNAWPATCAATSGPEMSYGRPSEMNWAKWLQCHTRVWTYAMFYIAIEIWVHGCVESMAERAFGI